MRIFKRNSVRASDRNPITIQDPNFYIEEGSRHFNSKHFHKAVASFTEAPSLNSSNPNIYKLRGVSYEAITKSSEAEQDFLAALNILSPDVFSAHKLGMLYARRRLSQQAVAWLKISFEHTQPLNTDYIDSNNHISLSIPREVIAGNLGKLLMQLNQPEKAICHFDEVINSHPEYANLYYLKGMALAQTGNVVDGIPFLETLFGVACQMHPLRFKPCADLFVSIYQSNVHKGFSPSLRLAILKLAHFRPDGFIGTLGNNKIYNPRNIVARHNAR